MTRLHPIEHRMTLEVLKRMPKTELELAREAGAKMERERVMRILEPLIAMIAGKVRGGKS